MTYSINWIDDCSYVLILQKAFYKTKEIPLIKDTIMVKITKVLSDTSYRCNATATNTSYYLATQPGYYKVNVHNVAHNCYQESFISVIVP